jgi:hypothetical protein
MKKQKSVQEAPVTTEATKPADNQELQRKLGMERQQRSSACAKEVEALLAKFNCTLEVGMLVRANGSFPQITIVARDNA